MKKLNYYNYVWVDDDLKPMMTGVYHDNGLKIASNTHIMIIKREEYLPEFEGRIVAKDGHFIEGRFPNYKMVIPDLYRNHNGRFYEEMAVDFNKLAEIKGMANEEAKQRGRSLRGKSFKDKEFRGKVLVEIGGVYLRLDYFLLLADFMKGCGMETVWCCSEARPIMAVNGDNTGLLMPKMYDIERDERELPEYRCIVYHL